MKFWFAFVVALGLESAVLPPAASASLTPDFTLGLKASLGMNVTAGLDKSTRKLVERLPAEVRKQMLLLLEDALPMIDDSVLRYVDAVEVMIDRQMGKATCQAKSVAITGVDELRRLIPLTGPPKPVAGLRKEVDKVRGKGTRNTPPITQHRLYVDLLTEVSTRYCQVYGVIEAMEQVEAMAQLVRRGNAAWVDLGDSCENAADCHAFKRSETQSLLDEADPRDVEAIDGRGLLAAIAVPPKPSIFNSHFVAHEDAIVALYGLDHRLATAKAKREALAEQAMAGATDILTMVTAAVSRADGYKNKGSVKEVKKALDGKHAADKSKARFDELVRGAADLNPALQPVADGLQVKYEQQRKRAIDITEHANARIEKIYFNSISVDRLLHNPSMF